MPDVNQDVRIPTTLLFRESKDVRFLAFLKHRYGWRAPRNLSRLAKEFGCSYTWVNKAIQRLISKDWIGTSIKWIYPRSWKRIVKRNKYAGTYVDIDTILNRRKFTAFAYKAVVAYLLKVHRKSKKSHKSLMESPHRFGISCSLAAKKMGVCKSTSWHWRNLAEEYGYIKITHRSIPRPEISVKEILLVGEYDPGLGPKLFIKDGQVYEKITSKIEIL